MRFTLGLACGLSLFTAVPAAQGQSGDFLAALVATRSSDATSATAYLAEALKKDPQESELIRQQLRILTIEGDFDAALPYAQDFLSIDPEDPLARNILRIEAIKRGDWQTALSTLPLPAGSRLDSIIETISYAAILTGDGQIEEAFNRIEEGFDAIGFLPLGNYARGMIHSTQGRHEDAADSFAAFINQDPFQYPRMAQLAAEALERSGDADTAARLYDALLAPGARSAGEAGLARLKSGEPMPDTLSIRPLDIYTELLFVIARLLADQDSPQLAYRYAQEIGYLLTPQSSLYPGYTEVIASSLLDLERFEDAEKFYTDLEQVEEFRLAALLGQVQALSDQQRYQDALDVLSKAEALLGGAPGINRQRGVLYFRAQDYQKAVDAFGAWRDAMPQLGPNAAQPLFITGIAYYRLNDYERMEDALLASLELQPDDPDVLNFLAYSWVERGLNLERGFDMLNRAVEMRPDSGAIIDSLGWAYYQLGEYEEALPHLERAFQLNPWSWEIAEHVGDVYWQLGREREAVYFWERALDLPDIPEDHVTAIAVKLEDGLPDDDDAAVSN